MEIPVHLRTKEKNVVNDSSLLKDKCTYHTWLFTVSQLRTTVIQGSKKVIRVGKEASCLVTENQLQIFSYLHQPMRPWVNHLTFPHSFIFQCPPHAAHSIWNAFLTSPPRLNSYKMLFCEVFPHSLNQISFFPTHIPSLHCPYFHYIIYHMALLLHIYHFV